MRLKMVVNREYTEETLKLNSNDICEFNYKFCKNLDNVYIFCEARELNLGNDETIFVKSQTETRETCGKFSSSFFS